MRSWIVCVLLVACGRRGVDPLAVELEAALAASDAAWAVRDEGGLDAVEAPLLDASPWVARHPEAAWRRTRVALVRGLISDDPVEARRRYDEGRSIALDCLAGSPEPAWGGVAEVVRLAARSDELRAPCAAWGALAWSRAQEDAPPPGSALDAEAFGALLDVSRRFGVAEEQATWAWALWRLRGGVVDPEAGRALLGLATRLDEGAWIAWADAARRAERRPGITPKAAPSSSEERAVLARWGLDPAASQRPPP